MLGVFVFFLMEETQADWHSVLLLRGSEETLSATPARMQTEPIKMSCKWSFAQEITLLNVNHQLAVACCRCKAVIRTRLSHKWVICICVSGMEREREEKGERERGRGRAGGREGERKMGGAKGT